MIGKLQYISSALPGKKSRTWLNGYRLTFSGVSNDTFLLFRRIGQHWMISRHEQMLRIIYVCDEKDKAVDIARRDLRSRYRKLYLYDMARIAWKLQG